VDFQIVKDPFIRKTIQGGTTAAERGLVQPEPCMEFHWTSARFQQLNEDDALSMCVGTIPLTAIARVSSA